MKCSVQLPLFVGIVFTKTMYSYKTCFKIVKKYLEDTLNIQLNLDYVFQDFEMGELKSINFFIF